MRPARSWFLFLSLTLLRAGTAGEEEFLPDFDRGKVKASFVLSVPPQYNRAARWPLVIDFHGAIAPARKGALVTRQRVWAAFVKHHPFLVAGLNGRSRAWGMVKGKKDDLAYARQVLARVKKKYNIDLDRVYLAGFSSGADFLCRSPLASALSAAGVLIVCPGPPGVVGLRQGELLKKRAIPFYFLTGEEDYIRKSGAFAAYRALARGGGRTTYREVSGLGHRFPPIEEYGRALAWLERTFHRRGVPDRLALARAALAREDLLLAAAHLRRAQGGSRKQATLLLEKIADRGRALAAEAGKIDPVKEPGRAYEAWWRLLTRFPTFPALAGRAEKEMALLEKKVGRPRLYKARAAWFRRR